MDMYFSNLRLQCDSPAGARIAVNADGGVTVLARNQSIMEKTQEKVSF